ncbi:MAG: hypothetical protein HRT58_14820 [Crocinitomicaceae bacterium]|nr:hypothetical protein [Flavobacteriales bacterium]NQZ36939.1 hypothetical protein [Crocinitomicaceae bacterium]
MKPIYFLAFIASTLLLSLSSCTASGSISNVEGKIIGTWEFDKVEFKPDGKSSYSDYSDGFQGSSMTFKEGGILEAYDKDLDTTASGFWYIDYYEEYDNEDDTKKTIYYMVGTLDIPELDIYNDLLWDELSVSNSKLNAIEKDKKGGRYRYKLKR